MKIYDNNQLQEIELPKVITSGGITIPTNNFTESDWNGHGFYFLEIGSQPDNRYYTSSVSKALVGNKYTYTYTPIERDIETVKTRMLRDLKAHFLVISERPRVSTPLGFDVDGSRNDILNFEDGQAFGLNMVRDADGISRNIASVDYNALILAVKENGINLYQTKWAKEEEIKIFTAMSQCINYEHQFIETVQVTDELSGELVSQDIYKNNVTEW